MSGKTHPSSCTATPDSPLAAVLADILSRKMRMTHTPGIKKRYFLHVKTIIRLKINPTSKKTAKEIWEYDALKKKAFMKKYPDYRYITVWEDEAYINHTSSSKVINESYMQSLITKILETRLAA